MFNDVDKELVEVLEARRVFGLMKSLTMSVAKYERRYVDLMGITQRSLHELEDDVIVDDVINEALETPVLAGDDYGAIIKNVLVKSDEGRGFWVMDFILIDGRDSLVMVRFDYDGNPLTINRVNLDYKLRLSSVV